MEVQGDATGWTRVSPSVILAASDRALLGTGLRVRDVTTRHRSMHLAISHPVEMAQEEARRLLSLRLGYGFWIDLGLVDHSPVYELRAVR